MLLIELIIHSVKDYPFIYNLDHPDYKNPLKHEEAFQEIAAFIKDAYGSAYNNIDGATVKKSWQSILEDYKKFKLRNKDLPSGSAAPTSSSIDSGKADLYKLMSFADDRFSNREVKSSFSSSTLSIQPKAKKTVSMWDSDDNFLHCNESLGSKPVVPPPDKFRRMKKVQKTDKLENKMDTAMSNISNFAIALSGVIEKKKEDSDELYEKSIHEYFKNLNNSQSKELMRTMLKIIQKYR